MTYPDPIELTAELKAVRALAQRHLDRLDGMIDVRLQCTASDWYVHTGDPSYDQCHHGVFAADVVCAEDTDDELALTARSMIRECEDAAAEDECDGAA